MWWISERESAEEEEEQKVILTLTNWSTSSSLGIMESSSTPLLHKSIIV